MKPLYASRIAGLVVTLTLVAGACSSGDSTGDPVPLFDPSPTTFEVPIGTIPPTTEVVITEPAPTTVEPTAVSTANEFEAAFAALLPAGSPGAMVRIDVQGETKLDVAVGSASFETGQPLTTEHAFRIASTTKPITAAAVLRLEEQGLLDIDDPIADYLPADLVSELHVIEGVSRGAEITIRQLLTHSSGLADRPFETPFVDDVGLDPGRVWQPRELVEYTIEHTAPVAAPGTDYHYSDDGYVLLGMIIESATGDQLHEVYRREILDPLEMNDTYLEGHEAPRGAEISHSYIDGVDAQTINPSTDWGGGGLVSTVADLARFGTAINRDGLFERPETHEAMLTDAGFGYGLGVYVTPIGGGLTAVAHDGFWGSLLVTIPELDIVVAATMNQFVADEATREGFFFGLLGLVDQILTADVPNRPDDVMQVEVDGRAVNYTTTGTSEPTVVFESGFGDGLESWVGITDAVAEFSIAFTYDRAGYGESDFAETHTGDGAHLVEDLRTTLTSSGHRPPYVLVGHSLGGMYAQMFARTYPDEVVGLVLVDATPAGYFARCTEAVGADKCGPSTIPDDLPEPYRSEQIGIATTEQQVLDAPPLAATPAVVLASGHSDGNADTDAIWRAAQRDQAAELNASLHITEDSGHYIHHDEPELVVEAIRSLVEANRGTSSDSTN